MDQVYGKSVAVIEGADDEKFGPNGGFTAVLSTPSQDRDGDCLKRVEWVEPLQDRYPLDMDHGMTVADTIGSFSPYFEGDEMKMDAFFASTPKAQEVRALIGEGHIRAVSVAFMTDKSKKDGEARRELLNAGVVAIPSNRDAIITMSKSAALRASEGREEAPESDGKPAGIKVRVIPDLDGFKDALAKGMAEALGVKAGGDQAMLQAAHDALVHLAGGPGNLCIQMIEDEDPTGSADGANKGFVIGNKSVIGSLEDLCCRVAEALCQAYPDDYPYPRATFLNDDGMSGTVVFRQGGDLYAAVFEDDGADVEIDTDNLRAVGLITTMVDDPDDGADKSADEVDTKDPDADVAEILEVIEVPEDSPLGQRIAAFEQRLDEVLSPQDSPAESPESPAASVEEPAADSADDAADDVAPRARAMELLLSSLTGS